MFVLHISVRSPYLLFPSFLLLCVCFYVCVIAIFKCKLETLLFDLVFNCEILDKCSANCHFNFPSFSIFSFLISTMYVLVDSCNALYYLCSRHSRNN